MVCRAVKLRLRMLYIRIADHDVQNACHRLVQHRFLQRKMCIRDSSYTTFEYSNVRVSADVLNDGGTVTVYADIKNTGDRAGREVVPVSYTHLDVYKRQRP